MLHLAGAKPKAHGNRYMAHVGLVRKDRVLHAALQGLDPEGARLMNLAPAGRPVVEI